MKGITSSVLDKFFVGIEIGVELVFMIKCG